MEQAAIVTKRLVQQQLCTPAYAEAHTLVGWMGAMQAQDYLASLWAVGVRVPGLTEQDIEAAIANGSIVRTWPMRGTIHLLAARDVRWMLELLTPRVVQNSQGRLRQLGIDAATLSKAANVLGRALEGGTGLPRSELYSALEQAGIAVDGQRGTHILGQLSMAQVLCIGPRVGKQPTFVLLDEWIPNAASLDRDEALATVALRYFQSHGPATRQDFIAWTGLTVSDARRAVAAVADQLHRDVVQDEEFWSSADQPDIPASTALLLPPFDEWLLGYRDRSAVIDADGLRKVVPGGNGIFFPIVVVEGAVVGIWKRVLRRDEVVITFEPFRTWNGREREAIMHATERYAAFLGRSLRLDLPE